MSPDLGRFLQPDPIGFKGDASNLYRYCGNDWANRSDPMGLTDESAATQTGINTGDGGQGQDPQPLADPSRGYGIDSNGNKEQMGAYDAKPDASGTNNADRQVVDAGKSREPLQSTIGDFRRGPEAESSNRGWDSFYRFLREPPSPSTAAWTHTGMWPTLIATGVVFGGFALEPLAAAALEDAGVMEVAIGPGNPFHVAYRANGVALNGFRVGGGQMTITARGAQTSFQIANRILKLPVLRPGAVVATKGALARNCVTAAGYALWKGWGGGG